MDSLHAFLGACTRDVCTQSFRASESRLEFGVLTDGNATVGATTKTQPESVELIYELLDAHDDTARLAAERTSDADWETHLDYLRALQRRGRTVLARMAIEVSV